MEGPMAETSLDLAEALGAEPLSSSQVLCLYIPNKDCDGNEFDPEPWIKEASELLVRMGRGVTIMPPTRGGSLGRDDMIVWEDTVIIYTYILDEPFLKELPHLREFLHRFGRETGQRETGFEFRGSGESRFYRITTYDKASI